MEITKLTCDITSGQDTLFSIGYERKHSLLQQTAGNCLLKQCGKQCVKIWLFVISQTRFVSFQKYQHLISQYLLTVQKLVKGSCFQTLVVSSKSHIFTPDILPLTPNAPLASAQIPSCCGVYAFQRKENALRHFGASWSDQKHLPRCATHLSVLLFSYSSHCGVPRPSVVTAMILQQV